MRAFNTRSTVVLAVVVGIVGVATILLALTVRAAQRINDKAERIALTGRGINSDTDSIVQLARTNKTAMSILRSADPLEAKVGRIVALARSINRLAHSVDGTASGIDSTAGAIHGSAGRINSSAGAINGSAEKVLGSARTIDGAVGGILSSAGRIDVTARGIAAPATGIVAVARRIDRDARLINANLDSTISIARAVKGDTGDILGQARRARTHAACIDRKLYGRAGDNGDCR